MSVTIIFATNNLHKIQEIKKIVPSYFNIITLKDAGIDQDIPEPYDTLEENAREKSTVIHKLTQQNCFSEDTGLEVNALGGAPGVKSARYAGEGRNSADNMNKLLQNMLDKEDRSARFRTVVSLIWNDEEYYFEGICEGKIIDTPRGDQGFGYDPVFVPDGSSRTFAEMGIEEKNIFSHRRKATDKLVQFLKEKLIA